MGTTRKLTARGRERREELMRFATRRFAENGFHPTSVSDIVDGVGVGKGVFYWYFPSKDDLLLEILRDALLDLRRTQQRALGPAEDPLRRLELGIRATLEWSASHADILRLVMFGWTEESFAAALEKGRKILISDTARHIEEAMEAGLIAPGDATMMATAMRGVTDELARQFLATDWTPARLDSAEGDAADAVMATATRMCLHGLRGAS